MRAAESVVFLSKNPKLETFTFGNLPTDVKEKYFEDEVVKIMNGKYFELEC